jgi:hypothetical protein
MEPAAVADQELSQQLHLLQQQQQCLASQPIQLMQMQWMPAAAAAAARQELRSLSSGFSSPSG